MVFIKEKAINAFNFLVADNRFVGAVLLPPRQSVMSIHRDDSSIRKVFDRAELYRELEREDKTRPIGDAQKPVVKIEKFSEKLV